MRRLYSDVQNVAHMMQRDDMPNIDGRIFQAILFVATASRLSRIECMVAAGGLHQ